MDRAIARAVTDKQPVPEIDFTLHTMEDNTQVSTMERVVKGNAAVVSVAFARCGNLIANGISWS